MAKSEFNFTVSRLQNLAPPSTGRSFHYDAKTAGLCICITAAGGRTFYFYKWANGKPTRVKLGKFPDLSISKARDATAELTGEIAKGNDPAAERRARRESPTLEALFLHWWENHSKPHKRTWADDKRIFDKYLGKHRNRRLATITKADVQRWHTAFGTDHGPYQANRIRALLSAMYGLATDLGYDGPNPCAGVRRFKEETRERFLQPDEMRTFFEALAEEDPLWRDYFLTLLFTGGRRGNVARMRWDEIDLNQAVWYLPGKQAKGGVPMAVVLPDPVMTVLQARREADPSGTWVFPSKRLDGPIEDPRKAWERIRKRSGLTDLRMHDLRRSLGSWQATLGTSLLVVGKSLGHRDHKTTEIYARLQLDPVRESVAKATAAMVESGAAVIEAGGVKLLEDKGGNDDEG